MIQGSNLKKVGIPEKLLLLLLDGQYLYFYKLE